MKLGFGLYRHMINPANLAFARQVGATHVDDGDLDVLRVIQILRKNNFQGVIIPDHAPQLTCDAPWHAGMSFAMGFLNACLKAL